jgi:hypothetical protein
MLKRESITTYITAKVTTEVVIGYNNKGRSSEARTSRYVI